MADATSKLEIFAESLLRYETVASKSAAGNGAAAVRVYEKLRRLLSAVLGSGGFRALSTRALTLAKADAPELGAVDVNADGSLAWLSEVLPRSNQGQIAKGEVILIAQLLGLLVTFIGEALMLRLVQDAWPKATPDDFSFDEGKNS